MAHAGPEGEDRNGFARVIGAALSRIAAVVGGKHREIAPPPIGVRSIQWKPAAARVPLELAMRMTRSAPV